MRRILSIWLILSIWVRADRAALLYALCRYKRTWRNEVNGSSHTLADCIGTCSRVNDYTYSLHGIFTSTCRIFNRPVSYTTQCGWLCFEAAELTRLSEMITEKYCFHDKKNFIKRGISTQEREQFRRQLHKICQIRNAAVHREKVNATTMRHHARDALDVLKTVRRLGGETFEQACGEALDRLIRSFWDLDSNLQDIVLPSCLSLTARGQDACKELSADDKKRRNIESAEEARRSAERRRAFNIAKMIEDIQSAQHKRSTNQQLVLEQEKAAAVSRAAKKQQVKDQEDRAVAKRGERALKIKLQEEAAQQAKQERAYKAEAVQMASIKRRCIC